MHACITASRQPARRAKAAAQAEPYRCAYTLLLLLPGERGIGGSKCGATAVNALLYAAPDGSTRLLTANVGDARILLVRGGEALCLTEEHVPDK